MLTRFKRKRQELWLPLELWREILIYVCGGYFQVLWALRCVCKSWKGLIKDDNLLRLVSGFDWTIREYSILSWMDLQRSIRKESFSTLWYALVNADVDSPSLYDASLKRMLLVDWSETSPPPHTYPTTEMVSSHKAQLSTFCHHWKDIATSDSTFSYVIIRLPVHKRYCTTCGRCPNGQTDRDQPSVRSKICFPYNSNPCLTGYWTEQLLYDGLLEHQDFCPYPWPIVLMLHKKQRGCLGVTLGQFLEAGSEISPEVARECAYSFNHRFLK